MLSVLDQLKKRRIALGFKQHDMMLRVGVSRQQYQRLESKGNPRLDTLELIAKGLKSELVLIPQEKLSAVLALLENTDPDSNNLSAHQVNKSSSHSNKDKSLSDDPWLDLLESDE